MRLPSHVVCLWEGSWEQVWALNMEAIRDGDDVPTVQGFSCSSPKAHPWKLASSTWNPLQKSCDSCNSQPSQPAGHSKWTLPPLLKTGQANLRKFLSRLRFKSRFSLSFLKYFFPYQWIGTLCHVSTEYMANFPTNQPLSAFLLLHTFVRQPMEHSNCWILPSYECGKCLRILTPFRVQIQANSNTQW